MANQSGISTLSTILVHTNNNFFVIIIVIVGTIITINFNIEEFFQISIKKAVPITSFNLFVLKYSAGKTEYSSHYSLTG